MDVTLDGVSQKLYRYDVDDTPVNGAIDVPPSSNWAFDHSADFELHTKIVRKTAPQTVNNSTTLVACTDLLFAVAANEVWFVCLHLYFNSGAIPDIKIGWTYPAGTTITHGTIQAEARKTEAETQDVPGRGIDAIATLVAMVRVGGTPGNIQLMFAQQTATVADTTVLEDTHLRLTQLV